MCHQCNERVQPLDASHEEKEAKAVDHTSSSEHLTALNGDIEWIKVFFPNVEEHGYQLSEADDVTNIVRSCLFFDADELTGYTEDEHVNHGKCNTCIAVLFGAFLELFVIDSFVLDLHSLFNI